MGNRIPPSDWIEGTDGYCAVELTVPNSPEWLGAVIGEIANLKFAGAWDDKQGDEEEAASIAQEILHTYDRVCIPPSVWGIPFIVDSQTYSGIDEDTFVSDTVEPVADDLLVFALAARRGGGALTVQSVADTFGTSQIWDVREHWAGDPNSAMVAILSTKFSTTPIPGTVTVVFDNDIRRYCHALFTLTGAKNATYIDQEAYNSSDISTLQVSLPSTPNIGEFLLAAISDYDDDALTASPDFTQLIQLSTGGGNSLVLQVQYNTTTQEQITDWSGLSAFRNTGAYVSVIPE